MHIELEKKLSHWY